jgi:hypothetical protein
MAINEIGQATKCGNELLQLARDFALQHFASEQMQGKRRSAPTLPHAS